jgi:uncharacterized membrane protein YoaT (DUF817 family)
MNRNSIVVLALLGSVGGLAAIVWREYVSFADADALLVACWVMMALLMAHRVDPKRDVKLALVALAGGALIESWGTRAGLWTYFSHEKPPLFILPAWPAAALATERIAQRTDLVLRNLPIRRWPAIWSVVMLGFVVILGVWTAPGRAHPLSWMAAGFVVLTLVTNGDRRVDLARFVAGSLLGYLLERWGTTSMCWTYWDGGTPPIGAVLSHGFATVAFARGADAIALGASRVKALA